MNASIILVLLIAASGALARHTPPQWRRCPRNWNIEVLLPHEECNKFYKCTYGEPVALVCPDNLLFNVITDSCDWPQNVDCKGRILPEEAESENVEPETAPKPEVDNAPEPVPETEVDVAEPDLETAPKPEVDNAPEPVPETEVDVAEPDVEAEVGPNTDAPLVPHWKRCPRRPQHWHIEVLLPHEECNKFYQCTHGKPVAFNCPANLLFNVKTNLCDWPQYVDCKGRILPEEPEAENVENETEPKPEVENGPKPAPETEIDVAEPDLEAETGPNDAPLVAPPNVDVNTPCVEAAPKPEAEIDSDTPLVETPDLEVDTEIDGPLVASPDLEVETEAHNPKLEPQVDVDAPLVATPELEVDKEVEAPIVAVPDI